MSGFSGINQFGSLTLQNGQKLSFKDIKDTDGDGKISKDEFKEFLKENKIDTIELSLVDKNNDSEITEEEFAVLEQKQLMQEAVNKMAQDISIDFAGTNLIPEITARLKDAISSYEDNYNGSVSEMAKSFEKELPTLYQTLKKEVLANDPSSVKTDVINNMINSLAGEQLDSTMLKALSKQLEATADTFIKSYKGDNLASDLKAHLETWLNKTDSEKMAGDVSKYNSRISGFGDTIESSELPKLKECAKQLLTSALDNGVSVKLGQQTITKSNLEAVLNKYTDGDILRNEIQNFIDGLSKLNKKEQIISNEAARVASEAEKQFTSIPGSAYAIDPGIIDYSGIDGYADDKKLSVKGKKNRGNIQDGVRDSIESLKEQIRTQIESMLKSKGVPFDKIAQVFDNVFQETLNQIVSGVGNHKTNHAWLNKNKKYESNEGIQTIIQNFIKAFNTNIASRVDEMNKSNTDMDLVDIDYTVMVKDENGEVEDELDLERLQEGGNINYFMTVKDLKVGEEQAKIMINKLKPQMTQKAIAMCKANGIEYDTTVFNTIFNNSMSTAIAKGTEDHNHFLHISHGIVNAQEIATTFSTEFKTNYTNWVNSEKAKLGK